MKRSIVLGSGASLALLVATLATLAAAAPRCLGERATIVGTDQADEIRGTRGDDLIVTYGGGDAVEARSGGAGDDVLEGGRGSFDGLIGGAGNDVLDGGSRADLAEFFDWANSVEAASSPPS